MKHYLMVDMGTGNTHVAVTDSVGNVLAFRSFWNTYHRDNAYPDAQYFLPEEWAAMILKCCDELHEELPDVKISAVSSAGARQSVVLLDKQGKPFLGLPNIDNRGVSILARLVGKTRYTVFPADGQPRTSARQNFMASKNSTPRNTPVSNQS